MNKDEALAELARRQQPESELESPETELERRTSAIGYPTPPHRPATYEEFAELMPLGRPPGQLPPNVDLTPLQSGTLGLHGAISNTGFGLQQLLADTFGAENFGKKVKKAAEDRRRITQIAREDNPKSALAGEIAGGIASSLPFYGAAKGVTASPYAAGIIGDTLWGGSQYTTEDESGILNALGSGLASAVIPIAGSLLGKSFMSGAKRITGRPKAAIGHDILEPSVMKPEGRKQIFDTATERVNAAKRLDPNLVLTPGEATGSPTIAANQAAAGKSPKGSMEMEEFWRLPEKGRVAQENKIVEDVLGEVRKGAKTSTAESSRKIRKTAIDIAEKQKLQRKLASEPFYKGSANDIIPTDISNQLLQDKNIAKAARNLRKQTEFVEAAKGMKKNSIATWDLIKRNLDDEIESALRSGQNNKARLLRASKEKLTSMLDNISPNYQKARNIFSSESEVVNEILNSDLGKIAKLKDSQLKNVSKILFDPAQVDPKVLKQIRTRLLNESPGVYYDALAHHMQTQISTQTAQATKRNLPAFYKAVLSDQKKFSMYADALKGNPKALQMLTDMRTAFQDIAGDFTPKSAAALEKTSMTTTRNAFAHVMNLLSKGGAYDEAAVKFITDPEWLSRADKILKMKDGYTKSLAIGNLILRGGKDIAKKTAIKLQERDLPAREDED